MAAWLGASARGSSLGYRGRGGTFHGATAVSRCSLVNRFSTKVGNPSAGPGRCRGDEETPKSSIISRCRQRVHLGEVSIENAKGSTFGKVPLVTALPYDIIGPVARNSPSLIHRSYLALYSSFTLLFLSPRVRFPLVFPLRPTLHSTSLSVSLQPPPSPPHPPPPPLS